MRTYTTCPGCGEMRLHTGRRARTHARCTDPYQADYDLEDDFLAAAEAGRDNVADALAARLDALDAGPPQFRAAAHAYAAWGWPVFPLIPGTKIPAIRHGFKNASTDPARIDEWWQRSPTANVGLPTGIRFDVLDVDFRHGGLGGWLALRDSTAMPDAHGVASTAHNGLHILLPPSGLGNHAHIGGQPGLDYRGAGGYIVAAPSVLADGRRYLWDIAPSPLVTRAPAGRP